MSNPSFLELRFLSELARTTPDPRLRALLREDLFHKAKLDPSAGLEFIIRACLLSEDAIRSDERLWNALELTLERARRTAVDVLIVTVKRPELAAARNAFDLLDRRHSQEGPKGSRSWDFSLRRLESRRALRVALTVVGEAQNYKMSSFMHNILGL